MTTKSKYPVSLAIVVLFACLTTFSACKKYEEGPALSFRSKSERVANTWTLESYYENGTNKTSDFSDWDVVMVTDKDGAIKITQTHKPSQGKLEVSGTWAFKNDKEQIEVVFPSPTGTQVWDVLRLYEKEFWYSYSETDNGVTTKYEFRMKEKE
jgi:hypothetical protein